MTKPNTIGLGEYTDADLLIELQCRGVMEKIIGIKPQEPSYSEPQSFRDALQKDGWDDALLTLEYVQRNRLATLIKGE